MMNLRRQTRLAIIIAGVVLMIVLGCWLFYWIKFIRPLDIFRAQELEAVQYFDTLNTGTLSELPAPTTKMRFISQGTSGILSPTNVHGRILIVRYAVIKDNNASVDSILNLYKDELIRKGWNQQREVSIDDYYSLTYSHGKSCVKLVALYGTREFDLEIWQDFLSQTFSPSLPSSKLLQNWDMGKTDIVTCP